MRDKERGSLSWGPLLFLATLATLLALFWWVLIYSGGAGAPH